VKDQIRATLKQLYATPGYSWWWDEEGEDGPQWALLLHDDSDTADDAGYIAIRQTDWRWAVKVVLGEPGISPNQPIFVCDTLQEAKRKVDMLIAFDSGPIPR
jgi:hypothetical protein